MINKLATLLTTILVALVGASCSQSAKQAGGGTAAEHKVLQLTSQSVDMYQEFPARLEGIENIEIRPMIEGFIEKVLVDEGEYVTKGQLLFVLKAPTYEQAVRNAEAAVVSAEAEVSSAKVEVDKAKPLVERGIISKFELISAENTLKVQEAALAQAKADLINAQVNLSYAKIQAPVSGIIGTLPYKLGSLVNSSTTDALTTVSNVTKVYAYFSINEKTQLAFFKNAKGTNIKEQLKSLPDVTLLLADNSVYDYTGKVESISGQVDEETGSFNVRAVFDNPKGILRTGNSATIRIPNQRNDALLIPQAATYEIQGNVFIYQLADSSQVKSTKVKVSATPSGQAYLVEEGLKAGDQVVVDGVNSLNDGDKITPKMVTAEDLPSLKADTEDSSNS